MLAPPGEAVDLSDVTDEDLARTSFARICAFLGASLVLIGLIGVMRWTAIGFGTMLLLLGVLAFLIGFEERQRTDLEDPAAVEDRTDDDDHDDATVPVAEPIAAGAAAEEPAPTAVAAPVVVEPAVVAGADPTGDPDVVTVSFRLPGTVEAQHVNLVGEFNDWSPTSLPMLRDGDEFAVDVPLAIGRSYRYRYLVDHERWENSPFADSYLPNDFGTDDSVIDLTSSSASPIDR